MKKIVFILFLGFFSVGLSHAQYAIPDKPKKQTSVYDYINLLSKSEARNLEQKLIRYSDSTSTQIVVIIVNSTKGEDINYLAANWGEKWGVGQSEKDNGVILLMAKGDRKVAIQAGRGTEGRLTDLMSKRIIESRIIPEFKRESYYKGLDKGTDGVFEVLTGEFKEEKPRKRRNKTNNLDFSWFIPIAIILFIIFGLFRGGGKGGGRGGRRSTAGTLLDVIILSSLGSRGGSSGGFGSGGGGFGGGFGGGSFGGGGASGSW